MALGDPVWGPSFERVYQALMFELVRERQASIPSWGCGNCGHTWIGYSFQPRAHAETCPLYLDTPAVRELLAAWESRAPHPPPQRDTRICAD